MIYSNHPLLLVRDKDFRKDQEKGGREEGKEGRILEIVVRGESTPYPSPHKHTPTHRD